MTPGGWSGDCVSLTPSAGSGPRVQGDHTHKAKKKGRIHESLSCVWTSLIAQLVKKNPPAMQETPVQFVGWEDPLEKGKATRSSILTWRIPCNV